MAEEKQTPEGNPEEIPEETPEGTQGDTTPKKKPEGEELPPEGVDYKKKFGESTSENQRILRENAKLLQEKTDLEVKLETNQRTLSEKELKEKYPDFEYMDDEEKEKARIELEREKRLKILEAKDQWREDYRKLPKETKEKIEKKGGEEAFKDFACSPENVGQKNLFNLAKQFLYEEPEVPPEEPKKPGLEEGTGGIKTPITPKKGYTSAEAEELRKRDSKKYNQLVAEGRMKII